MTHICNLVTLLSLFQNSSTFPPLEHGSKIMMLTYSALQRSWENILYSQRLIIVENVYCSPPESQKREPFSRYSLSAERVSVRETLRAYKGNLNYRPLSLLLTKHFNSSPLVSASL